MITQNVSRNATRPSKSLAVLVKVIVVNRRAEITGRLIGVRNIYVLDLMGWGGFIVCGNYNVSLFLLQNYHCSLFASAHGWMEVEPCVVLLAKPKPSWNDVVGHCCVSRDHKPFCDSCPSPAPHHPQFSSKLFDFHDRGKWAFLKVHPVVLLPDSPVCPANCSLLCRLYLHCTVFPGGSVRTGEGVQTSTKKARSVKEAGQLYS